MKKIILGAFLTLLIIFSLTFIKPNKAKAETPDLFLMNEIFLYDYDSFNFEPNFTNDYLLMTTILPSNVESNISAFLGWYKNLGYNNLLIPYYGDDVDNDKRGYFAIPLNGVLGANFQLGYNAQSPFAISFGVVFTDGTMQTWDTETTGYGSQILTLNQENLIKNIYCFWWEYKTADYVPSFKFLGVTDGYEIGYQNGENVGYDKGYQLGYNKGFDNGFRDGITQSEGVVIYERMLNFNQLAKPFNAENWGVSNGNATYDNGIVTFNGTAQFGRLRRGLVLESGHQIYISYRIKSEENTSGIPFVATETAGGAISQVLLSSNYTTSFVKHSNLVTIENTTNYIAFIDTRTANFTPVQIKDLIIIDLTLMYGENYEPTLEECNTIFTADYYEYNTGEPVQIGYFTGFYDGKDEGINQGINIGESNQINMNWIKSIFSAIGGVLSIQIFPSVTIGMIVGIPFIISLAWFVIKMFRGGGSE